MSVTVIFPVPVQFSASISFVEGHQINVVNKFTYLGNNIINTALLMLKFLLGVKSATDDFPLERTCLVSGMT